MAGSMKDSNKLPRGDDEVVKLMMPDGSTKQGFSATHKLEVTGAVVRIPQRVYMWIFIITVGVLFATGSWMIAQRQIQLQAELEELRAQLNVRELP